MIRFLGRPRRFLSYCHRQQRQYSQNSNELPKKCDAVVIGGGSLGCSTLYHLVKFGMKNVVLLERAKLTAGTTWHTAGLVWSLRPSDTDIELLRITRNMLDRLEDETGISPGWNVHGGLFLASSKQRLDEYKRLYTIGKAFGIESEVLSPADTKKLVPLIDESTLYGTLYCKGDGNVDPDGLCRGLTRSATKNGAKVIENCAVTDIKLRESTFGNKAVQGVQTDQGFIESDIVVNCTGAWAPQICKMVGVDIPLIPMKHSYVIFDKIEELRGYPNIRDHDEAVYYKIQGDSLQLGGYEMNPIILDTVQTDFAFGLYELDWDVFGTHIKGATYRMPHLKNVGIKSTICGPESFTPDHKPLMGQDPKVDGFFHGAGFNSAGMMLGGGCGNQLAQWVINGHPPFDMFSYDIRRFSPKLSCNLQWVKERSHEAYAKNYSIVYKHDEPLAGRNQFLSPIHSTLIEKGCVYQEKQGWERPGYFSDSPSPPQLYDWYGQYGFLSNENSAYNKALGKEYSFSHSSVFQTVKAEALACRNACAIFDMSYFGKFFLFGPDATEAAQYIFSNQMNRPCGTVVYTCMLNNGGGIEADLTVTVLDKDHTLKEDPEFNGLCYYIAVGGTTSYYSLQHVRSVLKSKNFNVQLIDQSESYGLMSIQGPQSRQVMSELFPSCNFTNESFPFSTHQIINLPGFSIRAMRLSFVGEMGWELHVPRQHCTDVYNKVVSVGGKYGLRNAGYRAIDSLSIEKGYRHWHADIRADDSPLESGLAFTCKLNSNADFLGRKAMELKKQSGPLQRRLVCLTIDDQDKALWGLEAIWDDTTDKVAGYLRRAEYAHVLNKGIGYGYICHDDLSPKNIQNKRYSIEIMGDRVPARVHLKSPFDPKNERIQGIY